MAADIGQRGLEHRKPQHPWYFFKVASVQFDAWHTELPSESDYADEALGQLPHRGWRQNSASCRIFANARPGQRRGTGDDKTGRDHTAVFSALTR